MIIVIKKKINTLNQHTQWPLAAMSLTTAPSTTWQSQAQHDSGLRLLCCTYLSNTTEQDDSERRAIQVTVTSLYASRISHTQMSTDVHIDFSQSHLAHTTPQDRNRKIEEESVGIVKAASLDFRLYLI